MLTLETYICMCTRLYYFSNTEVAVGSEIHYESTGVFMLLFFCTCMPCIKW